MVVPAEQVRLSGADLPGGQPVRKFDRIEADSMADPQVRYLTMFGPKLKRRDVNTQYSHYFTCI